MRPLESHTLLHCRLGLAGLAWPRGESRTSMRPGHNGYSSHPRCAFLSSLGSLPGTPRPSAGLFPNVAHVNPKKRGPSLALKNVGHVSRMPPKRHLGGVLGGEVPLTYFMGFSPLY